MQNYPSVGFMRPAGGVFCRPGLLCIVHFSSYIIEQYKPLECDFSVISEKELCLKKIETARVIKEYCTEWTVCRGGSTLI
jgi:hypothetical protein